MANITPVSTPTPQFKPKSFWEKPEGVTGMIFTAGIVLGGGYLLYKALPTLIAMTANILYLSLMLIALAAIVYMVLDPRMRNLVWYGYKSVMRWITGLFVTIDPIGILKSYVESLEGNLGKMSKQISALKGQKQKLVQLMAQNTQEINSNMRLAEQAKKQGQESQIVLFTRKAARMQESNEKYDVLAKKIEVLERILGKMYENSQILLEDTRDQVKVKEQERAIIRTSHSAMTSAMNVLTGDPDKRAMFEMAMENINNDVASKVGEMERFMDMSSNIMNSIDLQNGVFEEEGMRMLEEWEEKSTLMLLDPKKADALQLKSAPQADKQQASGGGSSSDYDSLFK
ncbi:MAG: hypothetical protein JNL70_21470 [Saprospiraceae bacterium]|nr:hypothetical protein [Saprospiraceae bacterium]